MWCNVGFAQCTKGDCRNGYGTYTWGTTTYVGQFKKGKKHGQGTLTLEDGDKFVGGWKKGEPNGNIYHYSNGDVVKLEYKNGKYIDNSSASRDTGSYQAKPGYEICRSTWKKLILIRNTHSKNTSSYHKIDAFVETAFELMLAYKGTNAMDTGNCEKLLSLAN